jgi:hypothetical protein
MIAETVMWQGQRDTATVRCAIASNCGGVDLEVVEGERVTRHERHADRSTAYERARELRTDFERRGYQLEAVRRE